MNMTTNLSKMLKSELYRLAKQIDPTVPYRRSTKQQFIDIIENNPIKFNKSIKEPSNDTCNYTEDYIQYIINENKELKKQLEMERKETEKWRNKYIEHLENNLKSITNPLPIPIKNPPIIVEKPIEKPIEIQPIIVEKPIEKPIEKTIEKPFDLISKIDKKYSKLSISEIIKQNSLIEYVNSLSQKDILDFGHKTRREFFNSRITQMNKEKKSIFGANLSKKRLKKTVINLNK